MYSGDPNPSARTARLCTQNHNEGSSIALIVEEPYARHNQPRVHELEVIFANINSLFDALGNLSGVSMESKSSSRHHRKHMSSNESTKEGKQPTFAIFDIFHKQFQILSSSLERCRAFVVEDFIRLDRTYHETMQIELKLEESLHTLEESLGNRAYFSHDITTPSLSPTLFQDDISEILALRDRLLDQIDS